MATRTRTLRPRAALIALIAAIFVGSGCDGAKNDPKTPPTPPVSSPKPSEVVMEPIPFTEYNVAEDEAYNASGIVPLADGHFLVVDNNTNNSLLDLRLNPDGQQAAPIVQRPLVGLPESAVDDLEDLAIVEENGRRYVFATPSLSVKAAKKKKPQTERPGALLRIAVKADGTLETEAMPGFRAWFIANVKEVAGSADVDPDSGGLNVEGLAWDPDRHALLFGIRTPVMEHAPIVVPVRVKNVAGPWNETNLEALPAIRMQVEPSVGDQGIRGMANGPGGHGFLLTVANATSKDDSPFSLYTWDGNPEGKVTRLPVAFARKMKPEGLTIGTVAGKAVLVVVDDGGGFRVVPLDSVPGLAGHAPQGG
jgi:hypothetical protein